MNPELPTTFYRLTFADGGAMTVVGSGEVVKVEKLTEHEAGLELHDELNKQIQKQIEATGKWQKGQPQ